VGKIEISAYDKAGFKHLAAQLLGGEDGNIALWEAGTIRP